MIPLEYQPPQPPPDTQVGATVRFTIGVGLGFAALGVLIFNSGDDTCCGLIGLCIENALAGGIFHLAGRFRRRRDPWGWTERKPLWTFYTGAGCFAAAALLAYLLHFVSDDLAVAVFVFTGAALSIASPWLVFCRR